MKAEANNKINKLRKSKAPVVTVDPSLNKYRGKVLFPKKLAIAEENLKGVTLPDIKKLIY